MTNSMVQYKVTLQGLSPLLMHRDNMEFGGKVSQWQKAPENKALSVSGDDRSPPWTWLGYVYENGKVFGIEADNLMTMLREGGSKIILKGKETYKKQTQSGLMVDQQLWPILVDGKEIPLVPFKELIGVMDFNRHLELAETHGFELLVKRAKIGSKKHVRVRPMFRKWAVSGSVTVFDETISGVTHAVLQLVLNQAGSLCGLGDWRPSSPASGTFGRFSATVTKI